MLRFVPCRQAIMAQEFLAAVGRNSVPRRGATIVAVGATHGMRSMFSPFRAVFLSFSDPDP